MAKQEKAKVDHSAVSGPAPENGKDKEGGFLDAATATLEAAGIKVEKPEASTGLLSKVTKGREFEPPRILIYGLDGLGKSSFAAQAPKAIFIQTEDGLNEIECERFPVATSYEDVIAQMRALLNDPHEYQTVVLDSLDWTERLIWKHVCERNNATNIEKIGGGFGKGAKYAMDEWQELLEHLKQLRSRRGMAIILTAHTNIERFEDPMTASYDRYEPRVHYYAADMFREWVDATLFLTCRINVKTEDMGFGKERGIATAIGTGGGERILKCIGHPAWVAKNRYNLPAELPFPKASAFDTFVKAMIAGREGTPKTA